MLRPRRRDLGIDRLQSVDRSTFRSTPFKAGDRLPTQKHRDLSRESAAPASPPVSPLERTAKPLQNSTRRAARTRPSAAAASGWVIGASALLVTFAAVGRSGAALSAAHRTDTLLALALIGAAAAAILTLQVRRGARTVDTLRTVIRRQNRRLEEISATNRMMDLLQVCHSQSEMAGVICSALPKLLAGIDGAFYTARGPQNLLDLQARWGDAHVAQSFDSNECWALRRGRAHLYEPARPGARCAHVVAGEHPCLCVPLVADGNAIAVLYLSGAHGQIFPADTQRLARTVAEQLALAFGNLRLQESLRTGAERDPLTELYNRRHLEISLQRELARAQRHEYPVSLIMLDVDHFKNFNDTHGHEAGDAVLREVAQVLKRHTRAEDVACRWGGEEFLLALPACALDDAYGKAEAIREAIAQLRVSSRGTPLPRVTASLGIACHPVDGDNVVDLINCADTALYQAKNSGRNTVIATIPPGDVVLFDPQVVPHSLRA